MFYRLKFRKKNELVRHISPLIAVNSPKTNNPTLAELAVPKLDVFEETKSINSIVLSLNDLTVHSSNPWDYKTTPNTFTVIDNSVNFNINHAKSQKARNFGNIKGFLQRYSKSNSLKFVRRISVEDGSGSKKFLFSFQI